MADFRDEFKLGDEDLVGIFLTFSLSELVAFSYARIISLTGRGVDFESSIRG